LLAKYFCCCRTCITNLPTISINHIVTMDAATLNKKRKRKQVDAASDATKKSKKLKNPPAPPKDEPEEEEEVSEEEEEEDAVSNEGSDEGENNEDGESDAGSELGDRAVARDVDGDVIPTDSAPILSSLADSEKFEDLKLSEKTMKAIQEMGFTSMTSIQRSVRPPLPNSRFQWHPFTDLLLNRLFHLFSLARTFSVQPRQDPERRSHS
jgi:hypothetical protein